MPFILQNLTKVFQERFIFENLSFEFPENKFISLSGPSGSGKSTLLSMLSGIDVPDSGTITTSIPNKLVLTDLHDNSRALWRMEHVGIVFQFFQLLPALTLFENILLSGLLLHKFGKKELHFRADKLLNELELEHRKEAFPKDLSGGELQRGAIARALINSPKIICADEPTGNLDRTNAKKMYNFFSQLEKDSGTSIIIVSHDPEIEKYSTVHHAIEDGKIIS